MYFYFLLSDDSCHVIIGYNLVSISMFVFAYGAMVGYLMIIKENLSHLIGVEHDDTWMKNAVLTVSSLLIILPISLQRVGRNFQH